MPSLAQQSKMPLTIRAGEKRDHAASLALFNQTFHCGVKAELWDWKYRPLPHGSPIVSLAIAENGQIIGHTAVLPVGVNLSGRRIAGGHCVDSFVAEDYRKGGTYVELAEHSYRRASEAGIQVLFGFPTPLAKSIKIAKLGFHSSATLAQYCLRLTLRAELAKRFHSTALAMPFDALFRAWRSMRLSTSLRYLTARSGGISLERSKQVPPGYDDFWRLVSCQQPLSIWKDAEYLRWRYDHHPTHQFEYFWLSKEGRMLALAIVCRDGEEGRLCELMELGQDSYPSQLLVTQITRELATDRKLRRLTFDGSNSSFFAQALASWRVRPKSTAAFCTRLLEPVPIGSALIPDRWRLTLGDTDVL